MKLNEYVTLGRSGLAREPAVPGNDDIWNGMGLGKR